MDERKQKLLHFIVEDYVATADPVGSKEVTESGLFDVSSATIRNDMSELEQEGYLYQPYTSAGRVPTDKGYRYYVNHLLHEGEERRERDALRRRVAQLEKQMGQLMNTTARALAEISEEGAFTSTSREVRASGIANLLRKPEFHEAERAYEIADFFDNPERYVNKLPPADNDTKLTVYIGDESAAGKKLNCSFIVSEFQNRKGEKQYLALLGPTRMNYRNNLRLMRYITELMSGGFLVALLVINVGK